jgi:hypothetical protein
MKVAALVVVVAWFGGLLFLREFLIPLNPLTTEKRVSACATLLVEYDFVTQLRKPDIGALTLVPKAPSTQATRAAARNAREQMDEDRFQIFLARSDKEPGEYLRIANHRRNTFATDCESGVFEE